MKFTNIPAFVMGYTYHDDIVNSIGKRVRVYKRRGRVHRDDGPAIEYASGMKEWHSHGHLHREDGPAIEYASGMKAWHSHGHLHREDGPAHESYDGTKRWYLHDQKYSKPEWLREVLKGRPLTARQRELLHALSENWEGTPERLYETVTNLAE